MRGGPNVNFNLQFIRTFYILRKGSVLFPCFSFVIRSIHSAIWRLMEKKWYEEIDDFFITFLWIVFRKYRLTWHAILINLSSYIRATIILTSLSYKMIYRNLPKCPLKESIIEFGSKGNTYALPTVVIRSLSM